MTSKTISRFKANAGWLSWWFFVGLARTTPCCSSAFAGQLFTDCSRLAITDVPVPAQAQARTALARWLKFDVFAFELFQALPLVRSSNPDAGPHPIVRGSWRHTKPLRSSARSRIVTLTGGALGAQKFDAAKTRVARLHGSTEISARDRERYARARTRGQTRVEDVHSPDTGSRPGASVSV